jgi:hypothetical protein
MVAPQAAGSSGKGSLIGCIDLRKARNKFTPFHCNPPQGSKLALENEFQHAPVLCAGRVFANRGTREWYRPGGCMERALCSLIGRRCLRLTFQAIRPINNKIAAMRHGNCMGEVHAAIRLLALLRAAERAGDKIPNALCAELPADITTEKVVATLVRYGNAQPELKDQPIALFAALVMHLVWPCRK